MGTEEKPSAHAGTQARMGSLGSIEDAVAVVVEGTAEQRNVAWRSTATITTKFLGPSDAPLAWARATVALSTRRAGWGRFI